MDGNQIYNMTTDTPPGLAAIPYLLGDYIYGGMARPYVPVNMSTADAQIAKFITHPRYTEYLSQNYAQFGEQLMNTVGALGIVDSLGEMTGYAPDQMRKDLSAGGRAFMGGKIGQFIAPFADQLLNSAGISGGSFIESMKAIHNNRLNLMGSGTYFNPLDSGQAHQAIGAASAMMTLTNGLMSQRGEDGKLSLMTNSDMTRGFDRERIASVMMRAAGSGMFTSNTRRGPKGFEQQLRDIVGDDVDLSGMTFEQLADGKADALVDEKTAKKLKTFSRQFADRMKGVTEAMSAMRDLTNEVDGIEEKLDDLTNGDWLKSGNKAHAAADATYKLKAISQVYNIDPNQAISQIQSNRDILQTAAGFNPGMLKMLGMDGGGMFGFGAQTDVLQNIEDKITASGARGDPRAEARIRYQGVNALAKSINTSAGRGAQLLAYARQTGVLTDEQAERFETGLTSGDRSIMGDSLNRLLTTMFGSAETGRKMMNDTQFMQSVRMGLSDKYGSYANKLMMGGAASEMRKQELVVAAGQRLNYANSALKGAGMSTRLSESGVNKAVDAVVADFEKSGDEDMKKFGAMFREQVDENKKRGMAPDAALRTTMNAFKKDPVTAKFAGKIELAVTRTSAATKETDFIENGGLEGTQAKTLLDSMTRFRDIDSKQASELRKKLKSGDKGAISSALSEIRGVVGGLSESKRNFYSQVEDDAKNNFTRQKSTIEENRAAEKMLAAAQDQNYGSEAMSGSITQANEAALQYIKDMKDPNKKAGAYERFWESFSKSKYGMVYGDKAEEKYIDAVKRGDVDYIKKMGRVSLKIKEMASTVMGKNGWDLTYTGFFNNGIYAGNSAAGAAKRDEIVNAIASNLKEDASVNAEDRDSTAKDIVGFLTGQKDLKNVLKVYDTGGRLESKIGKYIKKNDEFEAAQKEYSEAQGGYRDAMNKLVTGGRSETARRVREMVKNNPELSDDNIKELEDELGDGDEAEAIKKWLYAKQKMQTTQKAAESELKKVGSDKGTAQEVKDIKARQSIAERRKQKEMSKNEKTFAFMDSLDLDESTLDSARGKMKEAQDAMFKLVTEEEVAKKAKVSESKKLSKQDYAETAMQITKEKAANGDEAAMEVVKKYSAAQREQQNRVTGEITLRSGHDQVPAHLEMSIGGMS